MHHNRRTSADRNTAAWMISYADLMTFLLCVFVVLVCMGRIQPDLFRATSVSLRTALGAGEAEESGSTALSVSPRTLPERIAESVEGAAAPGFAAPPFLRVADGDDGLVITIPADALFSGGGFDLIEDADSLLAGIAERLRRGANSISIRGYAYGESGAMTDRDLRELVFRQGQSVAASLETYGVDCRRLTVSATAETKGKARSADRDTGRTAARRIEIVVKEDLIEAASRAVHETHRKVTSHG